MEENQNIESNQEDRKIKGQEELNKKILQEQTIKQPETTNPKSEIQTSEIENMEVHHHPNLHTEENISKNIFLNS